MRKILLLSLILLLAGISQSCFKDVLDTPKNEVKFKINGTQYTIAPLPATMSSTGIELLAADFTSYSILFKIFGNTSGVYQVNTGAESTNGCQGSISRNNGLNAPDHFYMKSGSIDLKVDTGKKRISGTFTITFRNESLKEEITIEKGTFSAQYTGQ